MTKSMNWSASKDRGRRAVEYVRKHAVAETYKPINPVKATMAAQCSEQFRTSGGKRRRSTISIGDLQAANLSTRTHIKITLPRLKFLEEGNDG